MPYYFHKSIYPKYIPGGSKVGDVEMSNAILCISEKGK
jgi:hypothetical protein